MSSCPVANQVVCNYDVTSVPTASSYLSSCGTVTDQALNSICNECWISPLNTTVILYRCIWEETSVTATSQICSTPVGADPNSPDCITQQTVSTTTQYSPAQSNTVIDQFATAAGTMTTMMGDLYSGRVKIIINCYLVIFMYYIPSY